MLRRIAAPVRQFFGATAEDLTQSSDTPGAELMPVRRKHCMLVDMSLVTMLKGVNGRRLETIAKIANIRLVTVKGRRAKSYRPIETCCVG